MSPLKIVNNYCLFGIYEMKETDSLFVKMVKDWTFHLFSTQCFEQICVYVSLPSKGGQG